MTIKYHIASDRGLVRFVRWFDKVLELKQSIYNDGHARNELHLELDRQLVQIQKAIDTYLETYYPDTKSIPDLAQALVDQLFEETQ